MAKFHYDLTGAEPIVRDVPIYDAADVAKGEFIMMGSAVGTNGCFITGYTGSSAEMVDGLGICMEDLSTTSTADFGDHVTTAATTSSKAISSIASTVATGNRYGKAIINPFAVYLTEYSQAAADDVALTQAWSTTTLTLTNIEQDQAAGSWILTTDVGAQTANFGGQLRYVASSGGDGSVVVLTAPTVAGATSDTIIQIHDVNCRTTNLNAAATKLKSQAAVGDGVSLGVVENYISADDRALEPLRQQVHDGVTLKNPKAYSDLVLLNSVYNTID